MAGEQRVQPGLPGLDKSRVRLYTAIAHPAPGTGPGRSARYNHRTGLPVKQENALVS